MEKPGRTIPGEAYAGRRPAITEYLDSLEGTPTLTGRTPRQKGLIHMMSKRAELELLDAISVYFHHATPGLGPDVETYQNAEWGLRQRDRALKGMGYFDGVLQRQPFVADELVKLPVPAEYQALQAWYARLQKRPSVRNRIAMSEPT